MEGRRERDKVAFGQRATCKCAKRCCRKTPRFPPCPTAPNRRPSQLLQVVNQRVSLLTGRLPTE
jgi:hypothetical protein